MNAPALSCAAIHTGVGYCLFVSGSYRNLQSNKQGSTLFFCTINQPLGPWLLVNMMCIKKQKQKYSADPLDDIKHLASDNEIHVDIVELEKLIREIDDDEVDYFYYVEASYEGSAKIKLISNEQCLEEDRLSLFKTRLLTYAGNQSTVKLTYWRCQRKKMNQLFSRYFMEKVWSVIFDNKEQ